MEGRRSLGRGREGMDGTLPPIAAFLQQHMHHAQAVRAVLAARAA